MVFQLNQRLFKLFEVLLHECDASGLAVTRIIVGALLLIDIVFERGLSRADTIWSDPNECRFPLFDVLQVLPLRYMYTIYAIMFIGNVGIILGFKYKISCILYLTSYWYLFLLDKSRWNNHSYLFGLLVTLLSITDANYEWSIDNCRGIQSLRHRRVPFWQYFLIRSQVFLVYFIAGLKKFDTDWLNGYSMNNLSEHWVFSPFKLLLSNESIDFYVVHLGGFMFDLTIGFFLVWNKSRFFAYFFCLLFNSMNSRIFSIGMFPYMMISVMPVFSAYDWPKQVINLLKSKCLPSIQTVPKKRQNKLKNDKTKKDNEKRKKLSTKEKITLTSIFIYLLTQLFLPHSHWITKGYNTWTNGLYGYSWDMMVHNWKHIHTRVTVVDKSMRKFYLNPQTWTKSMRWSHHSDMVKQYAMCAQKRLIRDFNITEPSIYIDSWISLNGRFAQRVYDPRVNLVTAEWSAFKRPDWVLPILSDLTDWRQTLKQYEDNIYQQNDYNSVIFIADFPGLTLSNYIDSHFPNTSLTVLKGWLKIEMVGTGHMMYTRFMSAGDHLTLPVNTFHRLTPIRAEAAAYMYVYANTSHQMLNDVKTSAHDIQDFAVITDADRSPWIRSFENMSIGLKAILEITLEMISTLNKCFFICLMNE